MDSIIEIVSYDFLDDVYNQNVCDEIKKHEINELSYDECFKSYLYQNKPCIIKNVTNDWLCREQWICKNNINFEYLNEQYKNEVVPVSDCSEKYFNSQKKYDYQFDDYITYWKKIKTDLKSELPKLYLKDWHLQKLLNYNLLYEVPKYFSSDWLNEYLLSNGEDDYMFVYMGPEGTWTPFHADVFTSFSWSANIYGLKKWIFYPPGEENKLRDNFGNLPYDCTVYKNKSENYIEIYQEAGDAIFVPSGWHHQVWNIKDTISINHNWINGCNIITVWNSMEKCLHSIEKEISDCSEMENWNEHCQIMLKSVFGLNYKEFFSILNYICNKRIEFLQRDISIKLFNKWILGKNHAVFDLIQIKNVLEYFDKTEHSHNLNLNESINFLLKNIKGTIP